MPIQPGQQIRRTPAILNAVAADIPANATTEVQVSVGGQDFEIQQVAARGTLGPFLFNFVPSDTDTKFATQKVDAYSIFGLAGGATSDCVPLRIDGGAGSKQERPLRIKAASTITVELQNTHSAQQTIYIAFIGCKLSAV